MADIQDIRAQLREIRHQPAASSASASGSGFGFYVIAALAVALGFGIVVFMPKIFSVQRTSALPVFHETMGRDVAAAHNNALPAAVSAGASTYAGKSIDEVTSIADAVCARQTSHPGGADARPNGGGDTVVHENDKLQCFLSEGLPRFCAPNQSRKAAADVINYFKGIEYANTAASIATKLTGGPARLPGVETAPAGAKLMPDPRVIVAVEGLIKAGYLSRAQREEIGANVPPDVKHRFALVIANVSPCPKPPWWAVWR